MTDIVQLLRDQAIRLIAFAITNHETSGTGCHPEPGTDCEPWCAACLVLRDLPPELVAAAQAHVDVIELDLLEHAR